MSDLTKLVVGAKYQVKEDCRTSSKFQYTMSWKKDGQGEVIKDALILVKSEDSDGDYIVQIVDAQGNPISKGGSSSYITKGEVKYLREAVGGAGSGAVPSMPSMPAGVLGAQPLNQIPLVSATDASAGLATMFASLLMGAIQSDQVVEMVEKAVKEVATDRIPRPLEVTFGESKKVVEGTHAIFTDVLKRIQTTKEIMLVGDAGCGKTHLSAQVAESLGLDFGSISCSSDMPSSSILGYLLPADGGKFEYTESDFVRIYENGGVFLFDEMDACDPAILLTINQALANGQFTVPQRKGNTVVKRHPNFICMSACNTFGRGANLMYAGRERLDESTLDRFRSGMFFMTYCPDLETKLIDPEVLAWGRGVRDRIETNRLKRVLSTRFLLKATMRKEGGDTLEQIKETYYMDWKQDEKAKVNQ